MTDSFDALCCEKLLKFIFVSDGCETYAETVFNKNISQVWDNRVSSYPFSWAVSPSVYQLVLSLIIDSVGNGLQWSALFSLNGKHFFELLEGSLELDFLVDSTEVEEELSQVSPSFLLLLRRSGCLETKVFMDFLDVTLREFKIVDGDNSSFGVHSWEEVSPGLEYFMFPGLDDDICCMKLMLLRDHSIEPSVEELLLSLSFSLLVEGYEMCIGNLPASGERL